MTYERPTSLQHALEIRARAPLTVLAGGTDLYPSHAERPLIAPILDISAVAGLRGVSSTPDGWRIGALTTWSDLVRQPTASWLNALVQAACEVGGIQIQNQGTLGGNLCNASPAADGVVALAALRAEVELHSLRGVRRLAIAEFVTGVRRTALAPDELLTAVWVPMASARGRSCFKKLGHRRYLVISIAMVTVALDFDDQDRITSCGIAVGACSPSVRRLESLEQALLGMRRASLRKALDGLLTNSEHFAALSPIDDVRGSAVYRRQAAIELVRRASHEVIDAE